MAIARPSPARGARDAPDALILLRRLQLLLWIVESREHAAFSERWRRWARDELNAIATLVAEPAGAG